MELHELKQFVVNQHAGCLIGESYLISADQLDDVIELAHAAGMVAGQERVLQQMDLAAGLRFQSINTLVLN